MIVFFSLIIIIVIYISAESNTVTRNDGPASFHTVSGEKDRLINCGIVCTDKLNEYKIVRRKIFLMRISLIMSKPIG